MKKKILKLEILNKTINTYILNFFISHDGTIYTATMYKMGELTICNEY